MYILYKKLFVDCKYDILRYSYIRYIAVDSR